MSEEKQALPKNAAFTLRLPLDREKSKFATIHIKDMTEDVFMAAKSMIDAKKDMQAVKMIVKTLFVGGDSPDLLDNNFVALMSASKLVLELIEPVDGELKKN